MKAVQVGPVIAEVAAPPALVFQMLAAIGQGSQSNGERADILERDGDAYVCDFWTAVTIPLAGDRLVRTRERVVVVAPDTVHYEHLDGPVRGLLESIVVSTGHGAGARMTYAGTYVPHSWFDGLRARFVARPAIERIMRSHFDDVRIRAEARAARSRVFAGAGQHG